MHSIEATDIAKEVELMDADMNSLALVE